MPHRVLFFDTETNGLPANRWVPPAQHKHWPHILQIAWSLWSIGDGGDATLLTQASLYVQPPPDMVWSAEAAKVHGLTRPLLRDLGVPAEQVLTWFAADAREADLIVAHNLDFDKKVVWAAAARTGLPALSDPATWWPKAEQCFMLATTNICKIPTQPTEKCPVPKSPYKWPRLSDVWTWLWPTRPLPTDLHDASVDVDVLVQCWIALHAKGLLRIPT